MSLQMGKARHLTEARATGTEAGLLIRNVHFETVPVHMPKNTRQFKMPITQNIQKI